MGLTAKVSKDFSSNRYTDAELNVKAGHIVTCMTNNASFPNPLPTLAEVTTANAQYKESLDKVSDGSKADTVTKNNLRAALVLLLQLLADYVQVASQGDEAIILSSGFDVNKKPSTVGPLDKPQNFKVAMGQNKGSVVLSCDVVDHAQYYEFEYTEGIPTVNSIWMKLTSTKHKLLIEGMVRGKEYTFRVAGAGSDQSRVWSETITTFVL
jgi:hypothetical protein